jgi:ABC-2 type transport system permease protein
LKQNPIPTGIAGLVIADPRTEISPGNLAKINDYIDGGGNLFLAAESDRKEITKPLFSKLGLSLHDGILIQPNNMYSSDCAFAEMTSAAKKMSPQGARTLKDEIRYYGDTVFRVAMAGASYIDVIEKKDFHIEPLLKTSSRSSWNRLAPISNDSLQLNVGKLSGDEYGSFATSLLMKRNMNGKDQRIIVSGDADYLSRRELFGQKPKRYNLEFGFWCFSEFTYGKFPPNTLRPESLDSSFKIKSMEFPKQKIYYYWIIPGLIALVCSVILFRRKRK